MHMADALLSPAVAGAMCAATAVATVHCARRLQAAPDDRRVPLMGVLGAFLFAAQMINFSIPGTGSSGHLGGGLLLAILVGPHAAFLVTTSVLIVQALFFADGGLLALGCNIFNLGFFPAFVGYPIYRWLCGSMPGPARAAGAAISAAVVSLQLGALAVVLETVASGISALPFATFALFMQPIHLAIGIVEGLVTAAVVAFVRSTRPEALPDAARGGASIRGVATAFLALALALGGVGALYASKDPDGLEWSLARAAGNRESQTPPAGIHATLGRLQRQIAPLPDYNFRAASDTAGSNDRDAPESSRLGTSLSGVTGGLITLALAVLIGGVLARRSRRASVGR